MVLNETFEKLGMSTHIEPVVGIVATKHFETVHIYYLVDWNKVRIVTDSGKEYVIENITTEDELTYILTIKDEMMINVVQNFNKK
jgi:hypothetical protein